MIAKQSAFVLLLLLLTSCSQMGSKDKSAAEKKADLYYIHGTSKLVKRQFTNALDLLLKAAKYRPNDTKVQNNLAMAYYFKEEFGRAKLHLIKSLEIDPNNSDARNNLASLYFRRGQYQLAKKEYHKVLGDLIYRHQYRVRYNLALIELKRKNLQEAKHQLLLALKEKHDYCTAHFKLGELAMAQTQYKKAYQRFKEAAKGTCYNLPAPHYKQAMALLKLGKQAKATEKLRDITKRFQNTEYSVLAATAIKKLRLKIRSHLLDPDLEHDLFEAKTRDHHRKQNL